MSFEWEQSNSTWWSKSTTELSGIVRSLSPFEYILFLILTLTTLISGLIFFYRLNNAYLVDTPAPGGVITEGVIGSPNLINPLLAVSDADRDLTTLIYVGLMRPTPSGDLKPALAKSFSVSEDGLTYHFVLRNDITFHDGTKVTADDVVFTVEQAQNPGIKSPRAVNWEGVRVEKINDTEVEFHLTAAYAPFLENTTLGILPKHIWQSAQPSEVPLSHFNVEPVGAGPYHVVKILRDASGIPEMYQLAAFAHYAPGTPHIKQVNIRFYRNEDDLLHAFQTGTINAINGISPASIEKLKVNPTLSKIHTAPLPRIFSVFLNYNRAEVFTHPEVRKALDLITPKQGVVDSVLLGYGVPLHSPLPPNLVGTPTPSDATQAIGEARALMQKNGWKQASSTGVWEKKTDKGTERLAFAFSTTNTPELKAAAETIVSAWHAFGADVELRVFEPTDLTQNIIRPRRYDALLFGEIVGRDLDLYAFWHSSQRNDPGLNIAQYTSITSDKLLEDARTTLDIPKRLDLLRAFESEVETDTPAIFLYAPDFIYILPSNVQNVHLDDVTSPEERFLNINEWYTNTDRIWPFLKKVVE